MVTNNSNPKEFEGKKLLILGGVKLACDIVEQAHAMGAYVIVADYLENSPAKAVADEGVLINAVDVDALVEYCTANNIDGVTTGFVDILMPVCYEVCKRIGKPYYATPKMLSMATNKLDFKETCMKYGVPVPQTYLIGKELTTDILNSIQYPVFVKPLDASGSRGAGVCYNEEELKAQFAEAVKFSGTDNAIVEDYITGREFLLDYIAVDGEFRLLEMFDRYSSKDRSSAMNYANISVAPSLKLDHYLKTVNGKVIDMFKDLGFTDGLIFLQGHTSGNRITFYEMGSRLGGTFYNVEQNSLGYNSVEMIVRYALSGKMINGIESIPDDVARFPKPGASLNYLLKCEGDTISRIEGREVLESHPDVAAVIQPRNVGDVINKDSIVDKPLFTIHYVSDNMDILKETLSHFNESVFAYNEDGKSMLMDKIQPEDLVNY